MPGWAGGVVAVQPFRFTVSYPLEVLLGTVTGSVAVGFALQAGWTVVFIVAAALIWRRGLRDYQAAGA
jgi:ABC-2 type transport system permease protein